MSEERPDPRRRASNYMSPSLHSIVQRTLARRTGTMAPYAIPVSYSPCLPLKPLESLKPGIEERPSNFLDQLGISPSA